MPREIDKRHVSRGSDGHRGSMSDMNLVLHQSVENTIDDCKVKNPTRRRQKN
jgi:hypothetical protein